MWGVYSEFPCVHPLIFLQFIYFQRDTFIPAKNPLGSNMLERR